MQKLGATAVTISKYEHCVTQQEEQKMALIEEPIRQVYFTGSQRYETVHSTSRQAQTSRNAQVQHMTKKSCRQPSRLGNKTNKKYKYDERENQCLVYLHNRKIIIISKAKNKETFKTLTIVGFSFFFSTAFCSI